MEDLSDFDLQMMRRALHQAEQAGRRTAIGCVIVLNDEILAEGSNEVEKSHDPTAHAEIVCIRRACAALGQDQLRGATLYSTLEPCGMCSMASIWSGIARIVFAAGRQDVHKMYFEDRHLSTMNFIADAYRNDLSVIGGVMSERCRDLYYGPSDHPPIEEQGNL